MENVNFPCLEKNYNRGLINLQKTDICLLALLERKANDANKWLYNMNTKEKKKWQAVYIIKSKLVAEHDFSPHLSKNLELQQKRLSSEN